MKRVVAVGRRLRKATKDSRWAEQQTSDCPPQQQCPGQNSDFHTEELNAFLETNDVGSLRQVADTLPEQHGDVAALLSAALEKGKLDPSEHMQDDAAATSGSSKPNPSGATAAEDGKEEENDKKSVAPKEILTITKDRSTKDECVAMSINAEFEGEDVPARVKSNGVETMISDCLGTRKGCLQETACGNCWDKRRGECVPR